VKTQVQNPFECHSDWYRNCCVDNFLQFADLAGRYLRSADALVAASVADTSCMDVHVFAICFLYRHSLELLLKDALWKSHYAITGEKGLRRIRGHRLNELWCALRKNVTTLCPVDFPMDAKTVTEFEGLIAQIEDHDLESDSFRYPYDSKDRKSHPRLEHVNLRVLHDTIHRAFENLGAVLDAIVYHYDERSGASDS